MNSFSLNEVQQSIQALVKESSDAASDNFHFQPSESDPSQSLSDGPPRAPPPHNPLRSCLSQPAAFIAPPKPLNGWVNRALGTITAVEATAREIGATLSFEDDDLPEDAILRALLTNAARGVESAAKSLKEVKHRAKVVLDRKENVITMLRTIDARITWLNAALPPLPPERIPIFFDACK